MANPSTSTRYLDPQAKRRLVHRIHRVVGHLGSIEKMIESERCADDILIQVAAARNAVGQIAAKILEEHLTDCVRNCMEGAPDEIAARVSKAVTVVLKNS